MIGEMFSFWNKNTTLLQILCCKSHNMMQFIKFSESLKCEGIYRKPALYASLYNSVRLSYKNNNTERNDIKKLSKTKNHN